LPRCTTTPLTDTGNAAGRASAEVARLTSSWAATNEA